MIFKAGRGRKAALISTVVGLGVLGLAAFSLRDRIREEWWLHRLESKDWQKSEAAAVELALIGSTRANSKLLQFLRGSPGDGFFKKLGSIGSPARSALPILAEVLNDPSVDHRTRIYVEHAIDLIEGPIDGPLIVLEAPAVECAPGQEAAVEFRATVKKHILAFFIDFEIPNVPVKLLRAEVADTASADFPTRTVGFDPAFFKGGFQVGVNPVGLDFEPRIAPGDHILLIKAIIRFDAAAMPGDYPVKIKGTDFTAAYRSLNSNVVLRGDGVVHLKAATGPPDPPPPSTSEPKAAAATVAAGSSTPTAAAGAGEFVFWAEDVLADPGAEKVAVKIFATSTEAAQGFSFALKVDPKLGKLRKVGIEKTASEAAEIDQFVYQKHAVPKGETAAGFLFDTVPPYGHLFPPGTNQHVATISVDVPAGAPSGSSIPVQLGSFGEPAGSNVFAVKGQSRSALIHPGTIFVGQSPVPPPIDLEAKAETAGEKSAVNLTWKTASSCDSIRIERDWKTLKVVEGDVSSYRDEEAGPGGHRYRVFTRKANKESFPSSIWTGNPR